MHLLAVGLAGAIREQFRCGLQQVGLDVALGLPRKCRNNTKNAAKVAFLAQELHPTAARDRKSQNRMSLGRRSLPP